MSGTAAYPHVDDTIEARFASVDCLFFVIGAQKAGTTWLSHYFKMHPSVSVPEWKEHDYWNMAEGRPHASRMLRAQADRRKTEGTLRKFVSLLPFTLHSRRQQAITLALKVCDAPYPPYSAYADAILANVTDKTIAAGEVCPEYALLKAETYAKMASLSPNVRFIFVLRDPVKWFISGVKHSVRKSLGKKNCTADAVARGIETMSQTPATRVMSLSRYDQTMKQLEASVPADHILYVFFEELFDQKTLHELCDFLGLPFVPGPTRRTANAAGGLEISVETKDQARIARALAPVYADMKHRFDRRLPSAWMESEALC